MKIRRFFNILAAGLSGAVIAGTAIAAPANGLTASAETVDALGWIGPYLPVWAGMPVAAAGAHDLVNDRSGDAGRILNGRDVTNFYKPMDLQFEAASAFAMEMPGQGHLCAITLYPVYFEARNYAEIMTYIPLDDHALDGQTGRDWNALILAHEAGHCRDKLEGKSYPRHSIMTEASPDQFALNSVYDSMRSGAPFNPVTMESFRAARLISAFTRVCYRGMHAVTHMTGSALSIPTPDRPAPSARTIDTHMLHPVYDKILAQSTAYTGPRIVGRERMCRLINDMPRTFYDIVKNIADNGTFPADSVQQAIVQGFVESVQSHARQYFQLDEAPPPARPRF